MISYKLRLKWIARLVGNERGLGLIGAAVAINAVVLVAGFTALLSSEAAKKQFIQSVRGGYAEQANKAAAIYTDKLIDSGLITKTGSTWGLATGAVTNPLWSMSSGKLILNQCDPVASVVLPLGQCQTFQSQTTFGASNPAKQKINVSTVYFTATRSLDALVTLPPTVSVPAPTLISVSPVQGSTSGGLTITLNGTGFNSGVSAFLDNTFPCTGLIRVSSSKLTCVTPAHTAGQVNVVVRNPDNQTGSKANAFTYLLPVPTISTVSANSAQFQGGKAITINGSNFKAPASVDFGGQAGTSVTVNSASKITVTVPSVFGSPSSPYPVSMVVTTPDGATPSKKFYYTGWTGIRATTVCHCWYCATSWQTNGTPNDGIAKPDITFNNGGISGNGCTKQCGTAYGLPFVCTVALP